ncbi:MAG TPA: glycerophosphodiester phosphodiesterase, partial [Frankiaceae bacterium]|nr:glycerophosphodiester phosphodiesterase [Frankiaceae bacterium]
MPGPLRPPIGFAHRGAPPPWLRENTLAAFRRALRRGAGGLESDVWLTADRVPVLHHDGRLGRLRRRALGTLRADELPPWLPALADLYAGCGSGYELSLDVKDPAAAGPAIEVARSAGGGAVGRLWLCADLPRVREWRRLDGDVRLVDSTSLRFVGGGARGLGRHAEVLRDAGVDAVNLRSREWSAPLVETVHGCGRLAFAWDAQAPAVLARL